MGIDVNNNMKKRCFEHSIDSLHVLGIGLVRILRCWDVGTGCLLQEGYFKSSFFLCKFIKLILYFANRCVEVTLQSDKSYNIGNNDTVSA